MHRLELEVSDKCVEAEGVVSLTLRSADGDTLPSWSPGAHVDVVLADGLVRQYSLCGPENDAGAWRIGVLREPDSRGGSQYVHDVVQPGHRLSVRGPRNNFELAPAGSYLFLAGGIGITPIMPMVRQAAALGSSWTLVYGGRTRSSMAFLDELCEVDGGDLRICPQDETGLLDPDAWLAMPRHDTLVYCCGPAPLLAAVEYACRHWPRGSLHTERFAPGPAHDSSDDSFIVELARSGKRVTVDRYRCMLDVLEEAGCEITSSCRAGICGTCITDVVAGIPEHNDDVLSDDERASNTVMLPCVSRSKTDVIVVDL